MRTTCEECGTRITLTTDEGDLIGDECPCGYYVTRYSPGFREEADWL